MPGGKSFYLTWKIILLILRRRNQYHVKCLFTHLDDSFNCPALAMHDAVILAISYRRSGTDAAADLKTDPGVGLDAAAVLRQRAAHGLNQLAAAPPPAAWRRVAAQFRSTLVLLLLTAAAVSAGLWLLDPQTRVPFEAIAILAVVLLNAAMGYWQQA
jgi:magnesium-transporting ATPase (P-type)